jgi:hypothetical protein
MADDDSMRARAAAHVDYTFAASRPISSASSGGRNNRQFSRVGDSVLKF